MLKRQRGSSPISFTPEPTLEADVAPTDLYEPDAKRRRYFAPSRPGESGDGTYEEDDAESSDGMRTPGAKRQEFREGRGRGKEWQKDAGEYGDANSLLHDLHAEQRHRVIFSSSSPVQPTSPPVYQHHAENDMLLHTSRTKGEPMLTYPLRNHSVQNELMKHTGDLPYSSFAEAGTSEEASRVSQRYEDTNKYVSPQFCVPLMLTTCCTYQGSYVHSYSVEGRTYTTLTLIEPLFMYYLFSVGSFYGI